MIPGNIPNFAREQSYVTPIQNSTLLPLLLLSLASQKHTPKTKSHFKDDYDYIVVGAGASGSVVASRLSDVESARVLLLEAGSSPPLITEVPGISRSFRNSDLDWQYFTEPQRYTAKLQNNKQMPWPSGKAIGGSGIINSNLYIRGSYENYDDWEAQGAKGWNSKEVFWHFVKAEDNKVQEFANNGYHGVGGPMTVEMFGKHTGLLPPLIRSQKQLGYPYVDPNGHSQLGAANYQGHLRNGQRCSPAKGYLVPVENRTNLDIIQEAFVTKGMPVHIMPDAERWYNDIACYVTHFSCIQNTFYSPPCKFNCENGIVILIPEILTKNNRATGVRFDYQGSSHEVKAKNEVILSAGAVNSAQLLMLSGIGPKDTLKKFRIPLVADLPVGENFHNHGGPFAFFTVSNSIPSFSEKIQDPTNIMKYINTRSGVLAASETIFALSFLKTNPLDGQSSAPDYQLYFCEADREIIRGRMNVPKDVYDQVYGPYENQTNIYCNAQLMKPRSRGRVSIRSSNPYDMPVIDPNYLQDPQDVKDAVTGLKECFRILDCPEMKRLGVKPFDTLMPGCEDFFDDTDAYLECCARSIFFAASHPGGTAKMGNPEDPTTVVDSKLMVKGITGLRVVDASIMPTVPTGNTYAMAVMIAEKASDMIKDDIRHDGNFKPHSG